VEHEKRNSDRQGQSQEEIDGRNADNIGRCRVDKQELLFKERQQREIEGNADRQPDWPISQGQNKKQIGSEHRDGQKRQKFGLAVTVKEQARDNQQLDLKRSERREIVRLQIRSQRIRRIATM
jgi:hypothetical protein